MLEALTVNTTIYISLTAYVNVSLHLCIFIQRLNELST